ncbi:hypothetical protein AB0I60_05105 [Actinosynnema sp. NPDC050436]|uniref:hypothetical protein n=1 Tax=Actinosynnema sp. NPDC050436 TaxID=3155659 RepID=UPI0033C290FE
MPAVYGVPAPLQAIVEPSPIVQVTEVGAATAVTETPGTDAVAETSLHPPCNHNHVGRLTNWSPAGLAAITAAGKRNLLWAVFANSAGETAATPAFFTQTGPCDNGSLPSGEHNTMNQPPGPSGCPSGVW